MGRTSPRRGEAGTRSRPGGEAVDAAVRILASRPHAAAELRRKLRQRGYEAPAIEAAVARLLELGYLDDAAFARSLVGWRSAARGRRAIASELAARGVARDAAAAALAETDPDAERAAARALAGKLLRSGATPDQIGRAAARLRRRGFGEDAVRGALRDLALEAHD